MSPNFNYRTHENYFGTSNGQQLYDLVHPYNDAHVIPQYAYAESIGLMSKMNQIHRQNESSKRHNRPTSFMSRTAVKIVYKSDGKITVTKENTSCALSGIPGGDVTEDNGCVDSEEDDALCGTPMCGKEEFQCDYLEVQENVSNNHSVKKTTKTSRKTKNDDIKGQRLESLVSVDSISKSLWGVGISQGDESNDVISDATQTVVDDFNHSQVTQRLGQEESVCTQIHPVLTAYSNQEKCNPQTPTSDAQESDTLINGCQIESSASRWANNRPSNFYVWDMGHRLDTRNGPRRDQSLLQKSTDERFKPIQQQKNVYSGPHFHNPPSQISATQNLTQSKQQQQEYKQFMPKNVFRSQEKKNPNVTNGHHLIARQNVRTTTTGTPIPTQNTNQSKPNWQSQYFREIRGYHNTGPGNGYAGILQKSRSEVNLNTNMLHAAPYPINVECDLSAAERTADILKNALNFVMRNKVKDKSKNDGSKKNKKSHSPCPPPCSPPKTNCNFSVSGNRLLTQNNRTNFDSRCPAMPNWCIKPNITADQVNTLLGVATCDDPCTDIVTRCSEVLLVYSPETVINNYITAARFGLDHIMEILICHIRRDFLKITKTQQFLELPFDIVMLFLQDDFVEVCSELDLFFAALRWVDYNKQDRLKCSGKLLNTIRYNKISLKDLVRHVEPNKLLFTGPKGQEALLNIYRCRALKELEKHPSQICPSSPLCSNMSTRRFPAPSKPCFNTKGSVCNPCLAGRPSGFQHSSTRKGRGRGNFSRNSCSASFEADCRPCMSSYVSDYALKNISMNQGGGPAELGTGSNAGQDVPFQETPVSQVYTSSGTTSQNPLNTGQVGTTAENFAKSGQSMTPALQSPSGLFNSAAPTNFYGGPENDPAKIQMQDGTKRTKSAKFEEDGRLSTIFHLQNESSFNGEPGMIQTQSGPSSGQDMTQLRGDSSSRHGMTQVQSGFISGHGVTQSQGSLSSGTGVTQIQGASGSGIGVTHMQGASGSGIGVTHMQGASGSGIGVTHMQGASGSGIGVTHMQGASGSGIGVTHMQGASGSGIGVTHMQGASGSGIGVTQMQGASSTGQTLFQMPGGSYSGVAVTPTQNRLTQSQTSAYAVSPFQFDSMATLQIGGSSRPTLTQLQSGQSSTTAVTQLQSCQNSRAGVTQRQGRNALSKCDSRRQTLSLDPPFSPNVCVRDLGPREFWQQRYRSVGPISSSEPSPKRPCFDLCSGPCSSVRESSKCRKMGPFAKYAFKRPEYASCLTQVECPTFASKNVQTIIFPGHNQRIQTDKVEEPKKPTNEKGVQVERAIEFQHAKAQQTGESAFAVEDTCIEDCFRILNAEVPEGVYYTFKKAAIPLPQESLIDQSQNRSVDTPTEWYNNDIAYFPKSSSPANESGIILYSSKPPNTLPMKKEEDTRAQSSSPLLLATDSTNKHVSAIMHLDRSFSNKSPMDLQNAQNPNDFHKQYSDEKVAWYENIKHSVREKPYRSDDVLTQGDWMSKLAEKISRKEGLNNKDSKPGTANGVCSRSNKRDQNYLLENKPDLKSRQNYVNPNTSQLRNESRKRSRSSKADEKQTRQLRDIGANAGENHFSDLSFCPKTYSLLMTSRYDEGELVTQMALDKTEISLMDFTEVEDEAFETFKKNAHLYSHSSGDSNNVKSTSKLDNTDASAYGKPFTVPVAFDEHKSTKISFMGATYNCDHDLKTVKRNTRKPKKTQSIDDSLSVSTSLALPGNDSDFNQLKIKDFLEKFPADQRSACSVPSKSTLYPDSDTSIRTDLSSLSRELMNMRFDSSSTEDYPLTPAVSSSNHNSFNDTHNDVPSSFTSLNLNLEECLDVQLALFNAFVANSKKDAQERQTSRASTNATDLSSCGDQPQKIISNKNQVGENNTSHLVCVELDSSTTSNKSNYPDSNGMGHCSLASCSEIDHVTSKESLMKSDCSPVASEAFTNTVSAVAATDRRASGSGHHLRHR